jgi:3-carboxy-cis,cis-muconate cycloisomerase
MLVTVSDRAWVQAMLDVEAALARAESRTGLIPATAAEGIASHCRVDEFDVAQLGRAAIRSANPVVPLVNALRAAVPKDAAPFVHRGATSQDILDTAMMLIARRGLELILADLEKAAASAAALADRHRATVMAARTLLQQALPTTFGLKAAGWLTAIVEARSELSRVRRTRLALQFGGAAGTLAALSDRGLEVARELAAELALPEPILPWHTARARVVELATALGIAAGVAGKVALDVVLLAQTEVGEVSERAVAGRGASSRSWPRCAASTPRWPCCKGRCSRNTSGPPAPGRRSGRHWRRPCGWPAVPPSGWRRCWRGCRSTPTGCDGTSTSPEAASWRSTW